MKKAVGDLTPFEIQLIIPEEFEGWYRRFIDVVLEVEWGACLHM